MRTSLRSHIFRLPPLLAAVVLVAACGPATGGATSAPTVAAPTPTPSATVGPTGSPSESPSESPGETGEDQKLEIATGSLGAYLTDRDGRALYLFTRDSGGTSSCTGSCAESWPPLTVQSAGAIENGDGVTGQIGTIKRADGSTQVTYAGKPLYYFAGDAAAGQTKGQGLNGVWFLVAPDGSAIGQTGMSGY